MYASSTVVAGRQTIPGRVLHGAINDDSRRRCPLPPRTDADGSKRQSCNTIVSSSGTRGVSVRIVAFVRPGHNRTRMERATPCAAERSRAPKPKVAVGKLACSCRQHLAAARTERARLMSGLGLPAATKGGLVGPHFTLARVWVRGRHECH